MTETLRQLMILARNLGLIVANKSGYKKEIRTLLLRDHLKLRILCLLPKAIKKMITKVSFLGKPLSFFDLETTRALIEAIFIENEYYFKSKNRKPKIIDLGSNIGLSVIYFKTIYPDCQIEAYEADPATFKILSDNILNYGFQKIDIYNFAVTNKIGQVNFYVPIASDGSPLMSTDPLRLHRHRTIKVLGVKLSGRIKEKVDFLKMDIEGSESEVLIDLDRMKQMGKIEQMNIEYHHHINKEQDDLSGFFGVLEKNNFGYQLHASQNTPLPTKTFEDIQIHAYRKGS